MKPSTAWGYLPNLSLPNGKKIGSELAIMQYIARNHPHLGGESDADFQASQELLHQAEELYQKLAKCCPTIMAKDKSVDDFKEFWTGADPATHSNKQGLLVYLTQFDKYMDACGAGKDRYTASGLTIGEMKLFATLYLVSLVDPDLKFPPNVAAFMARFGGEKATVAALDAIKDAAQYFIAPPPPGA